MALYDDTLGQQVTRRTLFGKPTKGSESLVILRGLGTWLFWQNPGCLLFLRLYETNTGVYFVSFILISSFLRPKMTP